MPVTRTFIVDFGSSVIKYGLLQPSANPPSGAGGAHTATTGSAIPTFYMTLNPASLEGQHSDLPPIAILPDLIVDALLAPVVSSQALSSSAGSLSSSATAQLTPAQQLQQQRALMNTLDSELKRALTTAQQQYAKSVGGGNNTADTFGHSTNTTATAPSPLLDFHVVLLSNPFVHSFEKRAMLEYLFNLTTLHIPAELCAKLGLEVVAAPKGDAPPRSRKSGTSKDGLDDDDDNAELLSNNQHLQGNGSKLTSSTTGTAAPVSMFLPVPMVISRVHLPNAQETALFSCGEVSATVVDIGPRRTTTITPVVNGSAMARHSVKVPVGGEDIIELTAQQYTACEGFSAADVRRAAAAYLRSEAAPTGGVSGADKLPSSLCAPVRGTLLLSAGGGGDDGDEETIVVAKLKQNARTPIEICERLLVDASLPLALRTMQPSPVVYNCGKMVEDLSKSLQLNSSACINPLQSSIPAPTTTVSALLSHINSSSNFKNSANINGGYQGSLAFVAASASPAVAAGGSGGASGGASNANAASETVILNNPSTAVAASSFLSDVRQTEFAGVRHYQVAASTTHSAIPPIFLMGGASTFPQMRSAFTLVVRRAFSSKEFSVDLLPTSRSTANDKNEQPGATTSGSVTCNAVSAPIIPFEFTSPLLLLASAVSSSPLTIALTRKSVALADASTSRGGGGGGDGDGDVNSSPPNTSLPPYSLLAPQLRFAFPPANLSGGGGGGSGPSMGSAGVGSSSSSSSKHSHVLRMAPFVNGLARRHSSSSKVGRGGASNSQVSSAALSFSALASLFGTLSPAMVSAMLAPCVGAAIAVQLPSFEEGAITRREYCR